MTCPTCHGAEHVRTATGKAPCPACVGSGLACPPIWPAGLRVGADSLRRLRDMADEDRMRWQRASGGRP